MTKQNELRAIERRQYWLIARMLFVGRKPMTGAADAILRGIEIVGLMYRFHSLTVQKKIIRDRPEPKYPKGGPSGIIGKG